MAIDHAQEATALFAEGYNCAQAVFSVYAEEYGMDPALAKKIATGFGGGIGRTGNLCGAVAGAILALSLAHGMNQLDDPDWRGKSYGLDQQFIQKFTIRFGSIQCPALLGYNMAIPDELVAMKKAGVTQKVCPVLIQVAIEILDEILRNNR